MTQQMNPAAQPEKKGMSKGCLVALIVGIVLVVIVVGAGLVCWYKKDALMKAGAVALVNGISDELTNNPVEGVDTTVVNKVTAAFIERVNASEKVDFEKFGRFAQELKVIMDDKQVDADEAEEFVDLMVEYYPGLEELLPTEEPLEEMPAEPDSLEQED